MDAWSFVRFHCDSEEFTINHTVEPGTPFPTKPQKEADKVRGMTDRVLLGMTLEEEPWERQLHQLIPAHRALPTVFSQLPISVIKAFQGLWYGPPKEVTCQGWNLALKNFHGSVAVVMACIPEILRELRQQQRGPTAGTFVSLISVLSRLPPSTGTTTAATTLQLWQEAQLALGQKDITVANAVLAALLDDSNATADFLATILTDGPTPNELTAATLLVDVALACRTLRALAGRGDPAVIASFGELLLVAAVGKPAGALRDVFTLYAELSVIPGFNPSHAIVLFLLQCAVNPDQFQMAWRGAQHLGLDRLSPRTEKALRDGLQRVMAAGPPPDFVLTMTAEVRQHGLTSLLVTAIPDARTLADLHRDNPFPAEDLSAALCNLRQPQALQRHLQQCCNSPSTVEAYNMLIEACGNDVRQAFRFFEEMEGHPTLLPDRHTHELLLAACIEAGEHQRAMDLLHRLRCGSWSDWQYAALLRLSAHNYPQCCQLVEEMPSLGLLAGLEALEHLASALPSADAPASAARQLLQRAHNVGAEVSHALVWRCAKCLPTVAEVRGLFPELQRLRPDTPGDTPNHELLLERLLSQGLGEDAVALLMAMVDNGLVPAASALRSFVPFLSATQATTVAKAVSTSPYPVAQLMDILQMLGPLGVEPTLISTLERAVADVSIDTVATDFLGEAAMPWASPVLTPRLVGGSLALLSVSHAMSSASLGKLLTQPLAVDALGLLLTSTWLSSSATATATPQFLGNVAVPLHWLPFLPTLAPAMPARPNPIEDGKSDKQARRKAIALAWRELRRAPLRSPPTWPQRKEPVGHSLLLLQFGQTFDKVAGRSVSTSASPVATCAAA
eukprot:GGOE01019816.1.p1 GENE.GGOE01019816.1~~GGOE01019816.1.p1  ORF type:complete len:918 (+),score=158.39 GGOE01019816.1:219-2756(+)